jgi:hypothetical protein
MATQVIGNINRSTVIIFIDHGTAPINHASTMLLTISVHANELELLVARSTKLRIIIGPLPKHVDIEPSHTIYDNRSRKF